jgi:hypothetical protein
MPEGDDFGFGFGLGDLGSVDDHDNDGHSNFLTPKPVVAAQSLPWPVPFPDVAGVIVQTAQELTAEWEELGIVVGKGKSIVSVEQ